MVQPACVSNQIVLGSALVTPTTQDEFSRQWIAACEQMDVHPPKTAACGVRFRIPAFVRQTPRMYPAVDRFRTLSFTLVCMAVRCVR